MKPPVLPGILLGIQYSRSAAFTKTLQKRFSNTKPLIAQAIFRSQAHRLQGVLEDSALTILLRGFGKCPLLKRLARGRDVAIDQSPGRHAESKKK
jgi:hypothetical protein